MMPLNIPDFLGNLNTNDQIDPDNLPNNILSSKNNSGQVSPNMGYHKYQTQHVLRDFFKDRNTFNFKYGLEVGLNSNLDSKSTDHSILNLDEDPTVFGFDLFILNNSALFNDVDGFMEFGVANNIRDITERRNIYNDFVDQFSKFFDVDDRGKEQFKSNNGFNSFKAHYLHGIAGLDKLLHYTGIGYEGGRQMVDYGKDKITINMSEDIGVNAGYLSALYRSFIYSRINGRTTIPDNLLRFDMSIIISEVRNMNRVSNSIAKSMEDANELIGTLKDNVSRYIFTLYDCQLNFNHYSFTNDIKHGGMGESVGKVSDGITFDVYYKYVEMEMEKFDFRPDMSDIPKYINDSRLNPSTYQLNPDPESLINTETDASNMDGHPNRPMDRRFQMNTINNSHLEDKSYEFDFPMMNSNYVKSNIDVRNKRNEMQSEETPYKSELNGIIDNANRQLQRKFTERRTQLLSGMVHKVRLKSGIRNISSPVNVYEGTSIGQFVLDQLHNFSNLDMKTKLSSRHGYQNGIATGIENSVFDILNRGADMLKGGEVMPTPRRDLLNGDIPNVYRDK